MRPLAGSRHLPKTGVTTGVPRIKGQDANHPGIRSATAGCYGWALELQCGPYARRIGTPGRAIVSWGQAAEAARWLSIRGPLPGLQNATRFSCQPL